MIRNLEDLFGPSTTEIPLLGFVLNLLLAAILALLLYWVYINYANSLSNRKQFGRNFLLITLTTVLIITIVKSSLALSLGLVGALSIIRFRAAIKEPEELSYLFIAIAIGLGFGANQRMVTIVAFVVIMGLILGFKKFSKQQQFEQNLNLNITTGNPVQISINQIIKVLKKHCERIDIRRLDETDKLLEASFMVESQNFDQLQAALQELRDLDKSLKVVFLDNKGLI